MGTDAELSESSVRLLLCEHERLAQLFIENRTMGERRTTLYLTFVAATTPLLAALTQLTKSDYVAALNVLALFVLLLLGVLTFYRLVERRIETVLLLRAINMIHRYFVDADPALAQYLYWKADSGRITFVERRGTLPGLRDLVQVLNGLLAGLVCASAFSLLVPTAPLIALLLVAATTGGLTWVGQQTLEVYVLRQAEMKAKSVGNS